MSDEQPTSWPINCPVHGRVYLTHDEYCEQVAGGSPPRWRCTKLVAEDLARPVGGGAWSARFKACGAEAEWDGGDQHEPMFDDESET